MKRDLIYLFLIVAAIAAAKVTAQTTPETPAKIRPQHIEAGFTKTVHILFPSPVTYIDIGSMDIIAGKADGAENVVRVKAAVRNFAAETNLTVITEDGGFFTFDVYYAENPVVSTLNLTVQEPQPESMKKPAAVGYPQPTAPASESRVLLREVTAFRLRFYADGRWQETWDRPQRLPQGLEITLTLANSGEITRLFLLTPGGGQ